MENPPLQKFKETNSEKKICQDLKLDQKVPLTFGFLLRKGLLEVLRSSNVEPFWKDVPMSSSSGFLRRLSLPGAMGVCVEGFVGRKP